MGIFGFVVGILFTVLVLLVFKPHDTPVVAQPGAGDVTISLDDTFITSQAARGVTQAQLPFTLSQVQAHISAGNVISIGGVAATPLGNQQFAASTQVSVANGHIVSHLTMAQVNSLPLPSPVTSALDVAINAQLASSIDKMLPSSTGLTLSGVTTTDGHLTLMVAQG
jgi:hypothetical protein